MSLGSEMEVVFQDLTRLHTSIQDELEEAVADVVARSGFVGAQASEEFEAGFAAAHHLPYGVGVGSGTDAIALVLRALGIGPGQEVIVPSMTFVATAEAVAHVGADPVIADVDPLTLLLDPVSVEAVRTDKTTAVVPVHLYGHVVPFEHLASWRASGLWVIEDAAQAHLATWEGRSVGSVGDAACFSFYPGKNLGAFGDGGAVLTADADLAAQLRKLRDHGRESKYVHDEIGWCSRLDGIQSAVLQVKLRHLPRWTESRRLLADRYRQRLGDRLVPWESGAVHHLIVVRTPPEGRDRMREALAAEGVAVGLHYPLALTQQPSLAAWVRGPCPNGEAAAASVLSLPMDPLMTLDQVDRVCWLVEEHS